MSISPPTGSRHEMNCPGRYARRCPCRKSDRVSGPCSTMRATRASSSTAIGSGLLVDRVARDDDHDVRVGVLDDGLAPEAGGRRQARRLVQEVVLALVRRRELLE